MLKREMILIITIEIKSYWLVVEPKKIKFNTLFGIKFPIFNIWGPVN